MGSSSSTLVQYAAFSWIWFSVTWVEFNSSLQPAYKWNLIFIILCFLMLWYFVLPTSYKPCCISLGGSKSIQLAFPPWAPEVFFLVHGGMLWCRLQANISLTQRMKWKLDWRSCKINCWLFFLLYFSFPKWKFTGRYLPPKWLERWS